MLATSNCLRAGRPLARAGAIAELIVAASLCPALAEHRCGWLENPTPGPNWWLKDAHGLWIISAQGGPSAEGIEKLARPTPDCFVATNGQYGYWCACLGGSFDAHAQALTRIDKARTSLLSVCRDDKALQAPQSAPWARSRVEMSGATRSSARRDEPAHPRPTHNPPTLLPGCQTGCPRHRIGLAQRPRIGCRLERRPGCVRRKGEMFLGGR